MARWSCPSRSPGRSRVLTDYQKIPIPLMFIAVNQMGAESPEGYLEFSIEAPPPPSHVDIEQGFFAVTMIPRLAAITNVSTQFDFWTSGEAKLPIHPLQLLREMPAERELVPHGPAISYRQVTPITGTSGRLTLSVHQHSLKCRHYARWIPVN